MGDRGGDGSHLFGRALHTRCGPVAGSWIWYSKCRMRVSMCASSLFRLPAANPSGSSHVAAAGRAKGRRPRMRGIRPGAWLPTHLGTPLADAEQGHDVLPCAADLMWFR